MGLSKPRVSRGASAGVPPGTGLRISLPYDERHKHQRSAGSSPPDWPERSSPPDSLLRLMAAAAPNRGRRRFGQSTQQALPATGRRHIQTGAVRVVGGFFRRSRRPHTPPGLLHWGRTVGASSKRSDRGASHEIQEMCCSNPRSLYTDLALGFPAGHRTMPCRSFEMTSRIHRSTDCASFTPVSCAIARSVSSSSKRRRSTSRSRAGSPLTS